MTPQYILRASLCREPHCASGPNWQAHAASEIDNLGFASEYEEPGYTQPDKGVLFANWNYFPRGIDSILESYGYAVEWSDEWAICDQCYKAVRTQPDSWGWTPSFTVCDGGLDCKTCNPDGVDDER